VRRKSNGCVQSMLLRYLLDELGEQDRDRLEGRLLNDRRMQKELVAAEDELADLYATGGLLPEQQRRFEEKFLGSPEWRDKVEFAKAMRCVVTPALDAAANRPAPPNSGVWRRLSPGWKLRLAITLPSVAAIFAVWLALLPQHKDAVVTVLPPPSPSVVQRARPALSFLVLPTVRGGKRTHLQNIVTLPEVAQTIELRVPLGEAIYESYDARIERLGGTVGADASAIKPERQPDGTNELRVLVDSSRLTPGSYTVVLSAKESGRMLGVSFRAVKGK
jgi:hypothetical protein